MSDTQLFGNRLTIKAAQKAAFFYMLNAVSMIVGGAMVVMKKVDWEAMWWMQKVGWFLLLVGAVSNTLKAFYSNSSKPTQ